MDPVKVEGIKNWKTPRNLKDVRSFLGFLNFYRRYIAGFSGIARPLNKMIAELVRGAKFQWQEEHENAFRTLIKMVTTAPVLQQPNFEAPFIEIGRAHV